MIYHVFVNPDNLQIIKNDKLSKSFLYPHKRETLKLVGLPLPVSDYQNEKDFNYLYLVYAKYPDGVNIPEAVFINEQKAIAHQKLIQDEQQTIHNKKPNTWSASISMNHPPNSKILVNKCRV